MKSIVVIGKSGQLAIELSQINTKHNLHFFGRNEIDITCKNSIKDKLDLVKPDAIINASAYTAVDQAESEPEQAFKINAEGVLNLVQYCKMNKVHFTHVSTDYVFGGDKCSPYFPKDDYNPQGVYGESKMKGELNVLDEYPENSCIIRTAWVYSSYGKNFVKTMLNLMSSKDQLNVVYDQIGSPTNAEDLAAVCLESAQHNLQGTFHWTDSGVCSWYDFSVAIRDIALEAGLLEKTTQITPVLSDQFPTKAKRPAYSVLGYDSKRDLPLARKYWRSSLEKMIKNFNL